MREPEVEFALRDGASIAYEVFGTGPVDLVLPVGYITPIDLMWDLPQLGDFLEGLAKIGRVIAYDPRGFGASDSMPTTDGAAGLENQAADLLAVMDAVGSDRASLVNVMFASSFDLVVAATYPERVRSIVLTYVRSSFPEMRGLTAERRLAIGRWMSTPAALKFYNPRVAHDPVLRRWWGKAHRLAGSPEQVARAMEYAAGIGIESILSQIRTPVLVFHRQGSQMWDLETSRSVAAQIPSARFVELAGTETDLFLGDARPVLDEIRRFVHQSDEFIEDDQRKLATVLFTDIVASTERLATVGDSAWRRIMDEHDELAHKIVNSHRGQIVRSTGDGVMATFDGPARAIRAAIAIRDAVASRGVAIRAGLHTGEIELRGDDVAGMAVHTGARVAGLAEEGEILVSSTVKDLVAGAGIEFADRGEHSLKGVPGTWKLYAVES